MSSQPGSQPGQSTSVFNNKEFTQMYASAEKLTGPFAGRLVRQAGLDKVPHTDDLVILDEACGTGIVASELMKVLGEPQKATLELTCADSSQSMVDYTARRIETSAWRNSVAVLSDATDTKLPSDKYTHILLNFGPMIFPDWRAGLRELHRMLRPGGTLAMSSWLKVGWVEDVREAFATDSELPPFPPDTELKRLFSPDGEWDDPTWVMETVSTHGFVGVDVQELPHTSVLDGVEEFARLTVGMVGLVQSKSWTQEQRDKYKGRSEKAVLDFMKMKYGGGEIRWDWVAILTTATKAN